MRLSELGFSLPFFSPLYASRIGQKILWLRCAGLTYEADPAVLESYLPPPLDLADARVKVIVTEQCLSGRTTPIFGGGVYMHCRHGDVTGNYPVVTFAHVDSLVCADREELGAPALLCDPSVLEQRGSTLSATVSRHGRAAIALSVELDGSSGAPLIWGENEPLLHYKKIPNGDPRGKALRQLLAIGLAPGETVRRAGGAGTVELAPSVWDVHQLAPTAGAAASVIHLEGASIEQPRLLWEEE